MQDDIYEENEQPAVSTTQRRAVSATQSPTRLSNVGTRQPELVVGGDGEEYIILSVDASRTEFRATVNGNPEDVFRVPSNSLEVPLAEVRATHVSPDWREYMDEFCIEWGATGLAIGKMAHQLGAPQSKHDNLPGKIMAAAVYFNLPKNKPVILILSLPHPSREEFHKTSTELATLLKNSSLSAKFNRETFEIKIAKTFFVPEGYNALLYTDKRRVKLKDTTIPDFGRGNTIVIDGGHEHLSFVLCERMRFQSIISKSETGLSMCDFCAKIADLKGIANSESPALIKAIIAPEGKRTCQYRGTPHNLEEDIKQLQPEFARDIVKSFREWFPDVEIQFALITGGGGYYFSLDLMEVLTKSGITAVVAEPYRYSNVLGGFFYGQARAIELVKAPA